MICFILQGYHGLGRHTKTLSQEDVKEFEHVAFFQGLISATGALGLLKISIAFSLLRLSKNKPYMRMLWALVGKVLIVLLYRRIMGLIASQDLLSPILCSHGSSSFCAAVHLRVGGTEVSKRPAIQ